MEIKSGKFKGTYSIIGRSDLKNGFKNNLNTQNY